MQTHDPDATTPPRVPGYVVGERVGVGARASVWSAVRVDNHREVAIKVVEGDPHDLAREVDALRSLHIDHLVPVHEVVPLAGGGHAVVMDLFSGGSMRSIVSARGFLTPEEVVTVLVPIASALAQLHTHGVVHGDVSPDNILLDSRGRPALADLGASHAVGQVEGDVWGSDGFIAPEVLLGAPPRSASDIYGLAAVALFALTGRVPEPALMRAPLPQWLAEAGQPALVDHPLVAVLSEALSGEAAARPDGVVLANAAHGSATAEPLLLAHTDDPASGLTRRLRARARQSGPTESAPARRERSRRGGHRGVDTKARRTSRGPARVVLVVALAAALMVGGAAVVGRAGQWLPASGARSTDAAPIGGGAPQAKRAGPEDPRLNRAPTSAQVSQLVQTLADARAGLWANPTATGADGSDPVGELSAPGGPAWTSDQADLTQLRDEQVHLEGLRLVVATTAVVVQDVQRLTVRARIDTSEHVVVAGADRVTRPSVEGDPVELVLAWTPAGWRLWEVKDVA